MIKIKIFKTLYINQMLTKILWLIMQEKQLNLGKNLKLHGFSLSLFPSPYPQLYCSHEKQQPNNHGSYEKQQPSSRWRKQNRFGVPQKAPFLENCHYLTCLKIPQRSSIFRAFLYSTCFRAPSVEIAPSLRHWSKKNFCSNCLTPLFPQAMISVEANQGIRQ